MTLSVIILVHNQCALTARCLDALSAALSGIAHEVICVDNASSEDLGPIRAMAPRFASLFVPRNERNDTFAVANNRAAAAAGGDCLLFLNNDVEVAPASIRALLRALSDADAGAAGGKLLFPETRRIQQAGMRQMLWGYASNYGVGAEAGDPRFNTGAERFALTGAMFGIRRDLFTRLGGFDEGYVWGYEDVDLCLKVRAAGRRVTYVPEAEGLHWESATLRVTRRVEDVDRNYRRYRQRWDPTLVPPEQAYLRRLAALAVTRVVIFGTGLAARGLAAVLDEAGVTIAGFTALQPDAGPVGGYPFFPADRLPRGTFDRLIVASQFFFQLESQLRLLDPAGEPLFPVVG